DVPHIRNAFGLFLEVDDTVDAHAWVDPIALEDFAAAQAGEGRHPAGVGPRRYVFVGDVGALGIETAGDGTLDPPEDEAGRACRVRHRVFEADEDHIAGEFRRDELVRAAVGQV